jgi:glucose-6-phosphate isomerase
MRYEHKLNHCLATEIGRHGIAPEDYARALAATRPALDRLAGWRAAGTHPFLLYSDKRDDLQALEVLARKWRDRFARVVVIGVGGASLGGQTVAALNPGAPLTFLENPDGARLEAMLTDGVETGFIAVSKSGATAETLAQTLLVLDRAPAANVLFVTSPGDNPLRRVAAAHDVQVLDHDPDLGGRFSVLSAVGALPALIAGLDAEDLRQGASETLAATLEADAPAAAAPAAGAALALALAPRLSAAVFMPYDDRLRAFALWQRQLWAESLGKAGHGATPVAARGAVDQHSQLQLYLDGPADKLFTLITVAGAPDGPAITPAAAALADADYLVGRSLGDLLRAEARATRDAIREAGRPVREIHLPVLDEAALGALMMHFMLETVIIALCLNIDPFDQPAVERGKQLARDYLRREGT